MLFPINTSLVQHHWPVYTRPIRFSLNRFIESIQFGRGTYSPSSLIIQRSLWQSNILNMRGRIHVLNVVRFMGGSWLSYHGFLILQPNACAEEFIPAVKKWRQWNKLFTFCLLYGAINYYVISSRELRRSNCSSKIMTYLSQGEKF